MSGQLPSQPRPSPRFVTGSITKHILIMTGTSAIGLMAVFASELLSLVFLGLLRDVAILSAMGYASSILFFSTSVGIGLSIATTSIVAPAVGAGDMKLARRLSSSALIFAIGFSLTLAALLWPWLGALLTLMGARGHAHELALSYLQIIMPTLPLTSIGMCSMAILRSVGDPQRAMNVTLAGAGVSVACEPFCIFMLKLGMDGSALAVMCARIAFASVGLIGVIGIHRMYEWPRPSQLRLDLVPFARVAVPAVLTNVATPIANAFTTSAVAGFGDAAMATWAVVGRVTPVAFGAVFCLTGAVGPILGQNLGARAYDRVRGTLTAALRTNALFSTIASLALMALSPSIADLFGLTGQAADLVLFYCRFVAPLFFFLGMLFIANAAFNTLGFAHYATVLNWGRASLGTVPLVMLGGHVAGAQGVFVASAAGGIIFGVLAVFLAYRTLPQPTAPAHVTT
jgi:putative MATE family efflux protein